MPYTIVPVGSKFMVQNTMTKHGHGITTLKNAKAQLRILEQFYKTERTKR